MADEIVEDAALKTDQDALMAAAFSRLVDEVGGATAAARLLGKARGTVEQWAGGRRRLPMAPAVMLAMQVDKNLDRFAIGGEEVVASAKMASSPVLKTVPIGGDYVQLPALRISAGAGPGRIPLPPGEEESDEFLAAKASWLRSIGANPARTEALLAKGDSMEPTIRDGDVLLVDRSIDSIVDNGIYVVVVAGAVVVKRLTLRTNGSVVLRSDNDRHAEEVVPRTEVHDLVVEGRVRWCGRPM